jgi:hypothetical protein
MASPAATVITRIEQDNLTGAVWLTDERLALVSYAPNHDTHIDQVGLDGRPVEPTTVIPTDAACGADPYTSLARIDEDHLGAVHQCESQQGDRADTFVVLDTSTGRVDVLSEAAPFPADFPYSVAWDAGRPGIYQSGDDLCATLYEVDGSQPLSVRVTVAEQEFAAGVDVGEMPDRCPRDGRAGRPAMVGDRLAFFASANAGVAGQDLIDRPWDLFVRDGAGVPRRVLGDVLDPGDQLWAADGQRLFILAALGSQPGAWAIDTIAGRATLLVEGLTGEFAHLSLSPSERRLVVLGYGEQDFAVVAEMR